MTTRVEESSASAVASAPNLRVCHLGKFYPPASGGVESHVRTLARAQAELGAGVHVICVNHANEAGQDVTWSRFASTPTVEEMDGPVRLTRLGRRASIAKFDMCPGLLSALWRLDRDQADILHLHVPNPTMLLAVAGIRFPMPIVVTYHSDVVRQRILGLAIRPFERWVFWRSRRILCTSPYYAGGSKLLSRYPSKVDALSLAIDLDPYLNPTAEADEFAQQLRARVAEPLWLIVGRLVYYKGIENAIHALPKVPGKLAIIGNGPLKSDLQALSRELGVAERVIWLGRVSEAELVGAYRAADALWMPSNARSEGFGLVQVEAMASGCPVINTSIPHSGVSWVSLDDVSGLTVPVNDHEALAAAARRLLEEPGLRDRLSAGAKHRAQTEFDHMRMARRSMEIYQEVLAEEVGARRSSAAAVATNR